MSAKVDTLEQKVKNLTKQSRDADLRTKWTHMKDAAAKKILDSTVSKLQADLKSAKTKQVGYAFR